MTGKGGPFFRGSGAACLQELTFFSNRFQLIFLVSVLCHRQCSIKGAEARSYGVRVLLSKSDLTQLRENLEKWHSIKETAASEDMPTNQSEKPSSSSTEGGGLSGAAGLVHARYPRLHRQSKISILRKSKAVPDIAVGPGVICQVSVVSCWTWMIS